jgi:GAF domain-containing protein
MSAADPRFAKRVDETRKLETRSVICVPLRSKLRVLGVIQLVNVDMERFKDAELFFLQSLCDYAAIAIENARWVEKIQELTITDDCTGLLMRGIFTRRWRPRSTGRRDLGMSSACCLSISIISRRSTIPTDI